MASDKPFNYRTVLWLLLTHFVFGAESIWAKHAQSSENNSSEDSDVENLLEKIDFADLVKDAKSVAAFPPSRQFRVGRSGVT